MQYQAHDYQNYATNFIKEKVVCFDSKEILINTVIKKAMKFRPIAPRAINTGNLRENIFKKSKFKVEFATKLAAFSLN